MYKTRKIKGTRYRYRIKNGLRDDDGDKLWGECDLEGKTIDLDPAVPSEPFGFGILVHEEAHAYLHECHQDLASLNPSDLEEAVCDIIAGFVLDGFKHWAKLKKRRGTNESNIKTRSRKISK